MKLDLLAIGAHPDDIELSCGGTILKHVSLGYTVGILDLTRGELGTRGSAELRTLEAMEGAKLLGVKFRDQLTLRDGFFVVDEANMLPIISKIREYQPEIILANALEDRHPDHGRAAKLVHDACFFSGLIKIETLDNHGKIQKPWRPKSVYHYIQDRALKPDIVFDISEFVEQKHAAIMAFKSQFFDPTNTQPQTPISSADYLNALRGKDSVYGRYIGASYGEGFNVQRVVGVKNLFDLM